jgi:hypothetical protein
MVEPAWTSDWLWGLPLTAGIIIFHVASVVGLWVLAAHVRKSVEDRRMRRRARVMLTIAAFGAVGLALAILAALEAAVWAEAYLLLGAIDMQADAILYSLGSLTTRGEAGLNLARHWRLMGAIEGANGVLLFGISTAFLAALLAEFWGWIRSVIE